MRNKNSQRAEMAIETVVTKNIFHFLSPHSKKDSSLLTPNLIPSLLNVGTGTDQTIDETAKLIRKVTEHEKKVFFDESKPDGTHQKILDIAHITNRGWRPKFDLRTGLRETYLHYLVKKFLNCHAVSGEL